MINKCCGIQQVTCNNPGYINVEDYKTEGEVDYSNAVSIAVAMSKTLKDSVIFFPASTNAYIFSNIRLEHDDITIDARYASFNNTSNGDALFILGKIKNCNLDIKRIESESSAGPEFLLERTLFDSKINVDRLFHKNPNTRIIDSDYYRNPISTMYFVNITGITWYHPLNSDTPAIVMTGIANSHSNNTIEIQRIETNTNTIRPLQPFIEIRCDGTAYQYGNTIRVGVEKCISGLVHLYSCYNSVLENITFYDLTQNGYTISAPLIKLSRGLALRRCKNTLIRNVIKTAGITDSGVYDIDLEHGENTVIESIAAVTNNMTINLAGLKTTVINCDDVLLSNTARATIIGQVSKMYEHTMNGLPVGFLNAKIFITDEVGGPTEAIYDGVNWLRVSDNQVVS